MPPLPDADATARGDHAHHDAELIAALAAGDLAGRDLETATHLVRECGSCEALRRDLRSIALALPAMRARKRTRDFRLTPEQAASVRASGWRRWVRGFAAARFGFTSPLGAGLATLGIVALLVAGPLDGRLQIGASAGSAAMLASAPAAAEDNAVAGGAARASASAVAGAPETAATPAPRAVASAAASAKGAGEQPGATAGSVAGNAGGGEPGASGSTPPAPPAPAATTGPGPDAGVTSDGVGPQAGGPAGSGFVVPGGDAGIASIPSPAPSGATTPEATRDMASTPGPDRPLGVVGGAALIAGFALLALRWAARRLA